MFLPQRHAVVNAFKALRTYLRERLTGISGVNLGTFLLWIGQFVLESMRFKL
jgi:hypothetical protein